MQANCFQLLIISLKYTQLILATIKKKWYCFFRDTSFNQPFEQQINDYTLLHKWKIVFFGVSWSYQLSLHNSKFIIFFSFVSFGVVYNNEAYSFKYFVINLLRKLKKKLLPKLKVNVKYVLLYL